MPGQRFPVPLARLFVLGQVFVDPFVDLVLGLAQGLFADHLLDGGEVEPLDFGRLELESQRAAGPLGERGRAVARPRNSLMCRSICSSIMSRINCLQLRAVENLLAIAVNPFALLVHHFVVFEQVLAGFEVMLLDLLLRPFDPAADHPAFDRFAFLHAEAG